jgi:predicted nucleic acid-binding protein
MILADTSIWIRHFRKADLQLMRLLEDSRLVTCDIVVGELTLGAGVPARADADLALLAKIASPSSDETLEFMRRHLRAFRAAGVGWSDAQIIVSAAAAGALLYTADRPQRSVWRSLGFRLGG